MTMGSRNTVPLRMFRMVPFGDFHIFLRLNSLTRASSGVMVAHLMPTWYCCGAGMRSAGYCTAAVQACAVSGIKVCYHSHFQRPSKTRLSTMGSSRREAWWPVNRPGNPSSGTAAWFERQQGEPHCSTHILASKECSPCHRRFRYCAAFSPAQLRTWIAFAASMVTWSSVWSRLGSPRSKYLMSRSK